MFTYNLRGGFHIHFLWTDKEEWSSLIFAILNYFNNLSILVSMNCQLGKSGVIWEGSLNWGIAWTILSYGYVLIINWCSGRAVHHGWHHSLGCIKSWPYTSLWGSQQAGSFLVSASSHCLSFYLDPSAMDIDLQSEVNLFSPKLLLVRDATRNLRSSAGALQVVYPLYSPLVGHLFSF